MSDSLIFRIIEIKKDNAIKLFNYADAAKAIELMLNNYAAFLSEDKTNELKNELKIWSALKDEPAQKITKTQQQVIKMSQDKAGLKNLGISFSKDTIPFIFDTGANISTVTKSTAQKMNMKLIPVDIEVGSITGGTVNAQLGISMEFKLGDIEIHNAVFLVFNDSSLYFPHIEYQINGILGFPVIEALEEIQITQDDYFIIPESNTNRNFKKNMDFDELTPLIYIDQMHFTFNTGADKSMLYSTYYHKNKESIDENYQLTKLKYGGAGGVVETEGFNIDFRFQLAEENISLPETMLLIRPRKSEEKVYGNIGQDVIGHFNRMTINFKQMFIKFDEPVSVLDEGLN